jgi:hypothetical protein
MTSPCGRVDWPAGRKEHRENLLTGPHTHFPPFPLLPESKRCYHVGNDVRFMGVAVPALFGGTQTGPAVTARQIMLSPLRANGHF